MFYKNCKLSEIFHYISSEKIHRLQAIDMKKFAIFELMNRILKVSFPHEKAPHSHAISHGNRQSKGAN